MIKFLSSILVLSIFVASTPLAFASGTQFHINVLESNGKKSKEVDSILSFSENSFVVSNKKTKANIKEFNYSDIQSADYSYSKKPLLSTGGAVAMAILTGLVVVPFLFVKKKQHWLSVRTGNDYVVMRLDKNSFRQILNEFEIHKVAIKTVDEDEKKKEK